MLSPLGHGIKKGAAAAYGSLLLKTGQTTQRDSELDDGYYEKGVAKSYTVNTTGSQSGTSNVDLAHYAGGAGAIAFNNSTKKITDSGNGLALFKTNDVILTNSAANPGPFTVTTGNVAGEITCTGATFTDETPAGAVTISKREAISNNTVLDNNTGLTWTRYHPAKFGATSTGAMVATGQLYDIYQYCAAANAASLGGYTDWRVPNAFEYFLLSDQEATNGYFDTTAFPTQSLDCWTSTNTPAAGATHSHLFQRTNGDMNSAARTGGGTTFLVRGG